MLKRNEWILWKQSHLDQVCYYQSDTCLWYFLKLALGNNVFLNGDLFEEVYINILLGYMSKDEKFCSNPKMVYKLHKSIHTVKQAFQ